ncbi:MAG: DUF3302 domain-containing protein [Lacunisphaera sp.]
MKHDFLDYLALGLLLGLAVLFVYVLIYIHDIPYQVARRRNHPQQDAIFVGCWLSLIMLHVLWPLLFLWAVSVPGPKGPPGETAKGEPS